MQGIEAGGHIRGHSPLLPLLESVLGQLDLPVLAAGGIGDGRTFAAVLGMGAGGARVGTRVVATRESGAHPAYKQAITGAAAGSTEITGAFAVCPLCATSPRGPGPAIMHPRVARPCRRHGGRDDNRRPADHPAQRARLPPGTAATGHIGAMAMYAGESVAVATV